MHRPFVIVAIFALVAPSLAMAQENVPQNRGGFAPHPGGPPPGGAPRLAPAPRPPMGPPPGGPPPGAGTFAPHPGGPPPGAGTFAPHPGGPPPGVVVGPPPGGFQNHPPGGPPPGAIIGPPPGDSRHFGGPGGGGFAYHGHSAAQVHVAPFVYPQGYGYQRCGRRVRHCRRFSSRRTIIMPTGPRSAWIRRRPAMNGCATDRISCWSI